MGKRFAEFIATAGGIGYLPLAPGTWSAIVSAIIWSAICFSTEHPFGWQIVILPLLIIAGVYSSGKILNVDEKDPSYVVIDEFAGLWLSLLFIRPSIQHVLAGLILFRFFDIAKPLGIKNMEKFKKGWGIMSDDLLAGIYSNLILQSIVWFNIW